MCAFAYRCNLIFCSTLKGGLDDERVAAGVVLSAAVSCTCARALSRSEGIEVSPKRPSRTPASSSTSAGCASIKRAHCSGRDSRLKLSIASMRSCSRADRAFGVGTRVSAACSSLFARFAWRSSWWYPAIRLARSAARSVLRRLCASVRSSATAPASSRPSPASCRARSSTALDFGSRLTICGRSGSWRLFARRMIQRNASAEGRLSEPPLDLLTTVFWLIAGTVAISGHRAEAALPKPVRVARGRGARQNEINRMER